MPNLLVWWTGNRNPSITETITIDSDPVDLSGSTVKFQMREVGSSTLIVDSAVSNSPGADGVVRYDWATNDVDTAGKYLVWWRVTTSGKTQDLAEAVIEIRDHAPLSNSYAELEMLKKTLQLDGTNFADLDIQRAIDASSRGIDWECGRRFYADTDATSVRYYTPDNDACVHIDDLITLTSVLVDDDGDGTFDVTWTNNTDFTLEPLNAAAEGWPYTRITRHPRSNLWLPNFPRSVKVTGKFGWTEVPDQISQACSLMAAKLLKRSREDPGGSAEALALGGAAVRLAGADPLIRGLMAPYIRYRPGWS